MIIEDLKIELWRNAKLRAFSYKVFQISLFCATCEIKMNQTKSKILKFLNSIATISSNPLVKRVFKTIAMEKVS